MTVTHTLPTSYDTAGALTQSGHSLIAGGGHSVGQTVGAPMYTIAAWTSYSNPMIWYDSSDQKWYDNNAPDAEPIYIVGTNTFSVPSTGWGDVTIANPQYVYIGNNTNGSGFQMGFNNPYYTAPPPPAYFDNSNGQPTITHPGPGGLGGTGAQSLFDSTNSSGNQLVYVPDPNWIGGNYPQYGFMFNWTGTGLERTRLMRECIIKQENNYEGHTTRIGKRFSNGKGKHIRSRKIFEVTTPNFK